MRKRRLIKRISRRFLSGFLCVAMVFGSAASIEMKTLASEMQTQELDENMEDTEGGYSENAAEMQITDETNQSDESEAHSTVQTQTVEENEEISDNADAESTEITEDIEDVVDEESEEVTETASEVVEYEIDVSDSSGKYENVTWNIVSGRLFVGVQDEVSANSGFIRAPWKSYASSITSVEVSGNGSLVNASYMFSGLTELEKVDLTNFKTDMLENTSHMFDGCIKLTTIVEKKNLSGPKVRNMSYMFQDCRSLSDIDLTVFDMSSVENMSYMFAGCIQLSNIIFSENMANVKNLSGTFSGCESLKTIDLSKFDTSNVENMSKMFTSHRYNSAGPILYAGLESITFGSNTANVTDMSYMFEDCRSLKKIDLTNLDTSSVTNMSGIFRYCSNLEQVVLGNQFCTDNVQDMSFMFYDCVRLEDPDLTKLNTGNVTDMSYMFSGCKINKWDLTNLETHNVTDMSFMFYRCISIEELDISFLDTANVTDLSSMFERCSNVKKLTLDIDTKNVTNMSRMFYECTSLEDITFGSSFKAEQVTDLSYMLYECSSLTSVDFSGFDAKNVTDMSYMFRNCSSLTGVDFSGFNASQVTNMSYMMYNCSSLTNVDFSGFDTSQVTNMSYMMYNCSSLTSVDFSGFDTSQVTNMSYILGMCSSLETLDLTSFNTSSVMNMSGMLNGCSSLTSVDFSSFNTSRVTDMSYMLGGCSSLKELDLTSFDTSRVVSITFMLTNCSSLKELDLRNFNLRGVRKTSFGTSFLEGCVELSVIHTPIYLYETMYLPKSSPDDQWYQSGEETAVVTLPTSLDHSILLMKNKLFEYPCITAQKKKTDYSCGETLSLDDLTVTYYDAHGEQTILTDDQYTTNAKELDLNKAGIQTLVVRYGQTAGETPLEISVELNVTGKTIVEISGITMEDTIYHAEQVSYQGKAIATDKTTKEPIDLPLVYSYRGELMDGTPYTDNEKPPVNAGHYTLVVAVAPDNALYTGSCEIEFTISKAPVTITADDVVVIRNDEPSQNLKYTYKVQGLFKEDQLIKEPSFDVEADLSTVGVYPIIPSGADAGGNYEISYVEGTLRVSDKKSVKITGIEINSMTYNALPISYNGKAAAKLVGLDGSVTQEDVTEEIGELIYTYSGTLADGTHYNETNDAPKDAGSYTLKVKVSDSDELYIGTTEYPFEIHKAPVTITADDVFVIRNGEPPQNLKYTYKVEGLFNEDQLIKEPLFDVEADLSTVGVYPIIPSGADAGRNYEISYIEGSFTVSDKRPVKITGIELNSITYNASPISLKGEAAAKLVDFNGNILQEDVTEEIGELIYTYSGVLADGTHYDETGNAPKDAGSYTLKIKVSDSNELYMGTTEYPFEIHKAPVTITAENVNIYMEEELPKTFPYKTEGFFNNDSLAKEPSFQCAADTSKEGTYEIVPYGAEAGMNYEIFYENGLLTVSENGGLIAEAIPHQIYTGKAIKPNVRVYFDNKILLTPGKDYTVKYYNNINADTDEETKRKTEISRDGTTSDGFTKEMAYVVITGKGNYAGTVYRNFYIDPVTISEDGINEAEGVVLKYKDQLVINQKKAQKTFQSIKCKKSMKLNKDFVLSLKTKKACLKDGTELPAGKEYLEKNVPVIPMGSYGTFELKIEGINNYRGTLTKTVYVTEKAYLMKNAKITLGKNLRSVTFVNGGVRMTPAYYDENGTIQYVTDVSTFKDVSSLNDAFMVYMGKECLKYDQDYTVTYKNNDRVGTATLIIEGKGKYMGTKHINFKVTGVPFTAKTVNINKFHETMTYTGEECRQDDIELTDENGSVINTSCYALSYKNNVKKGTASVTITANPESGYIGSIRKSYQITAADIAAVATVVPVDGIKDQIEQKEGGTYHLNGTVIYKRDGVKPIDRISLLLGANWEKPITLVENKDYAVTYTNNTSASPGGTPTMTITGKGNLTGTLTVTFNISKAPLNSTENLSIKAKEVPYKEKNQESYQYQPKIKVTDGKKALKEGTDYTINGYVHCSQKDVQAYLKAQINGESESVLQSLRPYAVIAATDGGDYSGTVEVDLTIYDTKLAAGNLYVVIIDDEDYSQTTYTGAQIRPKAEVYYGPAKAVKEAKKANVTDSTTLTYEQGKYKLTKLKLRQEQNNGDYTLEYGANIKAGKNKGSISIIGAGRYGGKVTTKFTIQGEDVFGSQVEPWSLFADKMNLIFAQ